MPENKDLTTSEIDPFWTDKKATHCVAFSPTPSPSTGCSGDETMNLKQPTDENTALEWSHLRPVLRDYGGQVVEQSPVDRILTPALCPQPSPLRSGSQRKKMKEREAIRRLNVGLIESTFSVIIPN